MARKIVRSKEITIPEDIEGCRLVPLSKGKPHFTKIQDNVLPNTYYRVPINDENQLRAMVTIMPDGSRIAWDNCGKCKTHILYCKCPSGAYHPSSIGWIRATCDINFPTEKVTDYSMYNDPYKRLSGGGIDPWKEGIGRKPTDSKSYKPVTRNQVAEIPVVKSSSPELSVRDIENLDLEKLGQEAKKQAKRTIRRARSVINGGK